MRVLFYIEPFPIRNVMTSYAWLVPCASRLAWEMTFTENSPEFRIFANRQSFEVAERLPDGCAIEPSDREQQFFENFLADWESQGIEHWLGLMNGDANFVPAYVDVLNSIYDRFPFDVIVHWGDNGAIEAFCRTTDTRRIAMELGCSRSPYMDTLCFDPFGANGRGAPPRVSIHDLEPLTALNGITNPDLLALGNPGGPIVYEDSFNYYPAELSRIVAGSAKPVAFFPLQLHDDANLLRYSNLDSPAEFLQTYLPPVIEAGYIAIVKPHPIWHRRPGGIAAKEYTKEVVKRFGDNAIWYGGAFPNASLLAQSDLVVTINSSVGFEALMHDRVVIVAGDAVYKPRDVFPTLEDFLSRRFCQTDYLRKIGILKEIFLNGYLAPSATSWHWQGFAARLQCVSEAMSYPQPSALAVIEALYGRFAQEQQVYRYAPWLERLGEV